MPTTAGGTFVVTTAADTVVSPFLVPGSTLFTIQVADQAAGVLAATQGMLQTADVAPVATLVQPTVATTQGQVFAGSVATFTLPFGVGQDLSGQYAATIDWGDGTAPTTAQVQAGATAGSYVVLGRHTYADIGAKLPGQAAGTEPMSVTIRRTGTSGASQVIGNTAGGARRADRADLEPDRLARHRERLDRPGGDPGRHGRRHVHPGRGRPADDRLRRLDRHLPRGVGRYAAVVQL